MRFRNVVVALLLLVAGGAALWWFKSERRNAGMAPNRVLPAAAAPGVSSAGGTSGTSSAGPAAMAPTTELRRLQYATNWDSQMEPSLAAFRDWVKEYLVTPPGAGRVARETAGLNLARVRRGAMRRLIERDPEAAFAGTVPMGVRAQLPSAIVAELETRFSSRTNFTVLAVDYDAAEIARRRALGLSTEPFQYTIELEGREYPASVYGRRTGETTKQGIPVHGLSLDGIVALHAGALRVLESGESAIVPNGIAAELAGRVLEYASPAELLRDEARLEAAEVGMGPALIPVASNLATIGGVQSDEPDISTAAAPATSWTVGAKTILVIRVDFSDLPGDPRRGSTIYTPAYVQDLADTQIKPYYAQSSFGQTAITTTVSSQVYRMPQTATFYAVNNANTQLHSDARAAAGAQFAVSNYDRIIVLFSTLGGISGSQITYGGLAQVGAKNVWVNGYFDFRVVAHELGHTYGLRHANLWQVSDGNAVSNAGTSTEYGDDFDTMGANFANDRRTDFNPWFKNLLGWAADSQVQTVTTSGTYRINRLDNTTGTGTLGLRITRDGTRNYWIGARRNFTTNASMQHGAYVMWGYNTSQASNLLDVVTPGSSVTDAALPLNSTLLDTIGNVSIRSVAEGGTAPNEFLDVQVTLGLNGIPIFSAQPQDQGFTPGATVTLEATVSGAAPLSYQWRKNGVDVPGATATSFTINNAQPGHAGSYTLRASNTLGAAVSNAAIVAVNAAPSFTRQPDNTTVTAGRTVTLSVGVNATPAPTYQWRKNGADVPGATGASLSFVSVQAGDGGSYDVVVTNTFGTATSQIATLAVNAAATPPTNDNFSNAWTLPGDAGIAIASNAGATGESGEPTHINANGTATSVWFRWTPTISGNAQIDTIGSNFDTVLAVYKDTLPSGLFKVGDDDQSGGLNTSWLLVPVTAGTTYYIAVGDFSSNRAGGNIALRYGAFIAPAITTQPQNQVSSIGGNASFSVAASGTNPTYQWFHNGVPMPGATGATLSLTGLVAGDAGAYYVVVANPAGSAVSNTVTLAGGNAAPVISTPPASVVATSGQTINLSVAATGSGTLAFQWRRNGVPIAGATNSILTLANVARVDADYYDVLVTDGLTTVGSAAARVGVAPTSYPTLVAPDPDWELRPELSGGAGIGAGYAVVPLSDGRAYIAGSFTSLNGTRRTGVARINSDGTLDSTFTPPEVDDAVRVMAVQSDGKIVIGGDFVRVGGLLRPRLARLNYDGSADPAFDVGTGANVAVTAIALQPDGRILVGGSFLGFAGSLYNYLIRLQSNGAVDTTFLTRGMGGPVNTVVVQPDGKIIVGGSFATYQDATGAFTLRSRLARLNANGTLDGAYDPAPNGDVNAAVLQADGALVLGGFFSTIGGTTVGKIARLGSSGAADPSFNSAAGSAFNSTINTLVLQVDGRILAGGTFTSFNGATANRFVRLNATGARDGSFLAGGFTNIVYSIGVLATGKIVVGGGFSSYLDAANSGTTRTRFAELNSDGTIDSGYNFTLTTPGTISGIVPAPGGRMIIAGNFSRLRGASVPSGVARLNADGTVDTAFNSGGSGANSTVLGAVAQPDGHIVLTGPFSAYNGAPAIGLVRLNPDGTMDSSFDAGAGLGGTLGYGYTLTVLPGGRIFVGGSFTSVRGLPRNRVAVLNPDGSVDPSFDPGAGADATVYSSVLQPDGKIVLGGGFHNYDGHPVTFLTRLNATGTIDSSFLVDQPGPDASVYKVALQPDGKLVIGGAFTHFLSASRLGLARLSSNGALDAAFVPPDLNNVHSLLTQEDGRIVVRGSFRSVDGAGGAAFLARLNQDGSRDTSFVAGGFTSASLIPSTLVMSDAGQLFMQSNGATGMSASMSAGPPTITVQPAARTVLAGGAVTLSVVAGSALPLRYQWFRNGTAVAGATNADLSLTNIQAATAGIYTVVVANDLGSITSVPANLTVATEGSVLTGPNMLTLGLSGDPAPAGDGFIFPNDAALSDGVVAVTAGLFNSADTSGTVIGGILYTLTRQGVRTIARVGNPAPGGGTFTGMGSEAVNWSGQVAFTAGLANTSGLLGLFTGTDAGITLIAREGQSEPGGSGGIFSDSINFPKINSNGQVAFWSSIRNTGFPFAYGVYLSSGGVLTRVARTNDPAPGGNGQISAPSLAGINDSGKVLITADLKNTSGGGADNSAIYLYDGAGFTTIARKNDLTPGGNDRLGELYGATLNRNNMVAFSADLRDLSGGFGSRWGVYRGTGGPLTKIVQTGDALPEGNGQFFAFNLGGLALNTQGDVAFTAELHNAAGATERGAYWGNGSELHKIARSGEPAPGGGVYTYFTFAVTNDSRTVMFYADISLGQDYRGIYLSDGTETMLVAKVGDPLAGSTISYIGFDPKNYDQFKQLAFQAILANGKWGFFLFSPKLKWRQSADGSWDDGSRWTVSLRPSDYAQVEIDPTNGGSVAGPANPAVVRTLKVGGTTTGTAALNLTQDGRLTVLEGTTIAAKGKLTGSGAIIGNVTNSGMIAPGNSAGVLNIDGNYTQPAGGSLALQLGGVDPVDYDRIVATGAVQLAGTITVELINGFFPATETFDVIRGQTVQLNSPQIIAPAGYTITPSIISGPEGQTLRLTLVSDNAAAPTISDIPNRTVNEDAGTGAIAFVIGDSQTPATSLTVTGVSSNTALIPNGNIIFGGSGANRTVSVTPLANQSGSAIITVTVSDGQRTGVDSFLVTVNPVDDLPSISDIPNQSINAGGNPGALAFTVGDVETPAAALVVSGSSSNLTLVPNTNIVFGGSGANRTVTVTPVAGQAGSATITVTVNDGALTASDNFVVTVNALPTISDVSNQSIDEDTPTGALAFTVGDTETAASSLSVTASSSNPSVIANAGLVLGGSGANRTVTVTPVANANGAATITLTVSDGAATASDTFVVTVNAVNDPPTISNIGTQVITTNTNTGPIPFVIGDAETAAGSLTVTASSSNQALVPNANVVLGGSGANRTVTVTPLADQTGSTTITITVSDGVLSTSDTFVVSVQLAGLSATHSAGGIGYLAGGQVTITSTLTYPGTATGVEWQVLLPSGWSYVSGSNEGPTKPAPGATDLLEWNWTIVPASPLSFTYTLQVPAEASGSKEVAALVFFHQSGVDHQVLATPDPLVISQITTHSADTNHDFRFSLTELLRVIELYNTRNGSVRTGAYAVDAANLEDGFATDPARTNTAVVTLAQYHSADVNHDGKLSLTELLRVIELYNFRNGSVRTGQYHVQVGTEDGFGTGP